MLFRRSITALIAACLLLPSAAAAQSDDGITVDPDSPSAKEYEVPTQQTRNEASGKSGKVKTNKDEKAPLFGEGVQSAATPTATATATVSATATSTAKSDSARRKAAAKRKRAAENREKARALKREEERKEKEAAAVAVTSTPSATPPALAPASAQTPSSGAGPWLLVGGILALVVIVGAAAGIPLRRRAKNGTPRAAAHPDPASVKSR